MITPFYVDETSLVELTKYSGKGEKNGEEDPNAAIEIELLMHDVPAKRCAILCGLEDPQRLIDALFDKAGHIDARSLGVMKSTAKFIDMYEIVVKGEPEHVNVLRNFELLATGGETMRVKCKAKVIAPSAALVKAAHQAMVKPVTIELRAKQDLVGKAVEAAMGKAQQPDEEPARANRG